MDRKDKDKIIISPLDHNDKNGNGFTFLDVLMALAILSIGLLSLAELQIITIKGNKSSRDLTSAVILAEAKIEELKGNGFASLSNGQDTVNEKGEEGGIFTRKWTITNYKGSANMKQVKVTIEWSDSKGSHSISLDTVLSNLVDK